MQQKLTYDQLLQLKRLTTPTVYNGLEQISQHERLTYTNRQETRDFMPQFGPMVGYAVTVVIEPSNPAHINEHPEAAAAYRDYLASVPGPKIVVCQDLDAPNFIGSFWGEVNAGYHTALGCVGMVIDGAVRDVDEMTSIGYKCLAKQLVVGHAYAWPVRWNCEVEVFGCKIQPGQLIHADKHGFLAVPDEDQERLLHAASFMDANECKSVIPAGRNVQGQSMSDILANINAAADQFGQAAKAEFGRAGEW